MLNRKYFPFQRNNYYYGKLLTARDFEEEQRYYNDKRRLANRLTGANGIVAGLGVIRADDLSLVIQAGCAYDASGREIVVPATQVVKLSTIEGFAQLASSCALLGIRYDEQPAEEMYAVMDPSGETRYNRVREQYRLTLLDEELAASIPSPMDGFVSCTAIYSDPDVELVQRTPMYVARGSLVRVATTIRRTGAGTGEYAFTYRLDAPGFAGPDGAGADIACENLRLSQGQEHTVYTVLRPEEYLWGGGNTALTLSQFAIRRGDETFDLNQMLEIPLKPVDCDIESRYLSDYYEKSMDTELEESYDERLWLARVRLIRQGTSVIIDRVEPVPWGQYCYNAQQLMMLRRLEEYYPCESAVQPSEAVVNVPTQRTGVTADRPEPSRTTSCGVFDFPIGMGGSARQVLFSDEIMHGLGPGPVCVQVGVEYIAADGDGGTSGELLFGDTSIFASDREHSAAERVYQMTTAVKVLPERGTFVVGLRLLEETGLISLRVRWFAFRAGEIDKQFQQHRAGEPMLLVNPDTIVLQPKSTAHISPVFINMPSEACTFSIKDPEGGSIDNNGTYTAPAREGVYEIRVEAVSDPTVYTYAFAIVSQKKKESSQD
ncbi:hypothetical protein [uncultured Ruthenibacterium sp.]|uniref:hypothetical protein n=1 Tax=uncultured Ruthenibacterium sp. TaxID=1905347 RepID=UPI00349EDCFF